jgi:hypothetical protein
MDMPQTEPNENETFAGKQSGQSLNPTQGSIRFDSLRGNGSEFNGDE